MQTVEVYCASGTWTVNLNEEEGILAVSSPNGELAHKSRGHLEAGSHIASLASQLSEANDARKAFLEQIALRDREIELLKASLQYRMKAYSALADRTGNV